MFQERDSKFSTTGDRGATLLEAAMLACLLSLVILVAVNRAGQNVQSTFYTVGSTIHDPNTYNMTQASGIAGPPATTTATAGHWATVSPR